MKNLILVAFAILLMASCKKEDVSPDPQNGIDTVSPIITIIGDNPLIVKQFDAYNDPGAIAIDAIDGECIVDISGHVNIDSAKEYVVIYSASDLSGNSKNISRTVIVSGAKYLSGSYIVSDYQSGILVMSYYDSIRGDLNNHNKIWFKKFAGYQNAVIYGDIVGSKIAIPSQVVLCGSPQIQRTFQGYGSYVKDSVNFNINYIETTNGNSTSGILKFKK